jgi:thymidylate kinase
MKLAFIGTHRTGKSTLVHSLIAKLKKQKYDVGFIGELTDECPFSINEKTTPEAQEWLLFSKHLKELELKNKYDILICDRSTLDNYVYYFNAFGKDKILEEFVKEKSKDYDFLFKVPITHGNLTKNKVASTNPEFQKNIEKNFNYLLKELKIPFQEYENLDKVISLIKNKTSY